MEEQLAKLHQAFDRFAAISKCQHLVLYFPYTGRDLDEFLESCFHRRFLQYLNENGFQDVALFTQRCLDGRLFLFLSRSTIGFDITHSDALHKSGAFTEAFGLDDSEQLHCYVFASNTLLEQRNFYSHSAGDALAKPGAGSERIASCLAIRDGYYGMSHCCKIMI